MLTSAHSNCQCIEKLLHMWTNVSIIVILAVDALGKALKCFDPHYIPRPAADWPTIRSLTRKKKNLGRRKEIFNQLEFSLWDALPCWAQSVFWDMLAPNSFFPPKRIKCPVLWRNDRRLFEEIVRNLWSFAKRQEQPRWMGAIPYWWLTTQTSQKAGSRFDFHTKSWFRVSSEPLPPTWPTPANDVWSHTNP